MDAAGGGAIGNMASVHAHICTLNKSSYNIAKFALRGLAKSISAEGEGIIRGFTISTGFVKTALALRQIPSQAKQRGISEEEVVTDVMMGASRVKEMMSKQGRKAPRQILYMIALSAIEPGEKGVR